MDTMGISVTLTGNFDSELAKFIKTLADDLFKEVKSNTPVKTGNAQRAWTKQTTAKSLAIGNRVPYIERLEAGASRQAPKGIIGPSLNAIKGKYK